MAPTLNSTELPGKSREWFDSKYPDESSCVSLLFHNRWPDGFTCPQCLRTYPGLRPRLKIICPGCGLATTITTNTIMHGTKKPLRQWLQAIWWVCDDQTIINAKGLQRLLKLTSYQTAWVWLQKLRSAMGFADSRPCRGVIEIGYHQVSPARKGKEKGLIICAAEVALQSGVTGRIKMQSIRELTPQTVTEFLGLHIKTSSSIIVPQLSGFETIEQLGHTCVIHSSKLEPSHADNVIQRFENWLNNVHRGGVAIKHLQLYIDEFCFRANSSMLADKKAVFNLLLLGVLAVKPKSYRELVGSS